MSEPPDDPGEQTGLRPGYWLTVPLAEMTRPEWEALCDGCGKCCLVLLEDDDNGEVWETDVACRLFDAKARRCTDYANRQARVPDCVKLDAVNAAALPWMPQTCAYRRLARGEGLPDWHPLITGDAASVAAAGAAVPGDLISDTAIRRDLLWTRVKGRRV